jgi:hypothetical protein
MMSVMGIFRQPSPSNNHWLMTNGHETTSGIAHSPSAWTPKTGWRGLALAIVGSTLLLRGVQVVTHWTGQPMFSWGLIAAGGLCVAIAAIPASWSAKAASTDSKIARHR